MSMPNRRVRPFFVSGHKRNGAAPSWCDLPTKRTMGVGVVLFAVLMLLLTAQFSGTRAGRSASSSKPDHRVELRSSHPPSASSPRRHRLPSPPSGDTTTGQLQTEVIKPPLLETPSLAASSSPQAAPSPSTHAASTTALDYGRTYSVSIAGRWFGGKHHWAAGLFECPSGCRVNFVHDGEEEKQDAILIHGQAGDLPTSSGWLRRSSSIRSARLLLYYAAENFEQMDSSQFLSQFNGEMSYRMRSIAREVRITLGVSCVYFLSLDYDFVPKWISLRFHAYGASRQWLSLTQPNT
jgi:hypothetical protein